jgi:CubicO group peptidase (beta-lactamase class C family)
MVTDVSPSATYRTTTAEGWTLSTQSAPATETEPQASLTPTQVYWPTQGWRVRILVNGSGDDVFASLDSQIKEETPFLNSIIIIQDGYIVHEAYFNGYASDDLQLLQSVTKSITSAVVGIALENGDINTLDVKLGEVLPDYFIDHPDASASADITLRDALMMRSGLAHDPLTVTGEFSSERVYMTFLEDAFRTSLIGQVLDVPLTHVPGSAWQYSTGDAQIVSVMFQQLTGQSLDNYAREYLFNPLNITRYNWLSDADGYTVGGVSLRMALDDLAKFGFLFLNDGHWANEVIIPPNWIQLTTRAQPAGLNTETGKIEPISWYGYQWWVWGPGSFGLPSGAYQAVGYGGQMVLILPDLDALIVTTSNSLVSAELASQQQEAIVDLIDQHVVPAL